MPMSAKSNWDAAFEEFWRVFPRKVGKLAARKEYDKVRRGGIGQEELLDGVAQYIRTKPSYADWCHPRTWLSQGRWLDEVPTPRARVECCHEPPCPDSWSHGWLVKAEATGDSTLIDAQRRLNAKRAIG